MRLSDIGQGITFLPAACTGLNKSHQRGYTIMWDGVPHLLLSMSFTVDHPGFRWNHPRVLVRNLAVLEFKHEYPNGGKYYTRKLGITQVVAIPAESVEILGEVGFSFPRIRINGAQTKLNVTGFSGPAWTDWVKSSTHTLCNLDVKDAQLIADAGLLPLEALAMDIQVPPVTDRPDRRTVLALLASRNPSAWLRPGMRVILTSACSVREDVVSAVDGRHRRVEGLRYGIRYKLIDWAATAEANGYAPELPEGIEWPSAAATPELVA